MNILVVNDDGYNAPGIAALVRELRKEHDVFVCAPKENQSAVGHGLTLRRLLHAEKVTVFDDDAKNSERELKPVTAFWVEGSEPRHGCAVFRHRFRGGGGGNARLPRRCGFKRYARNGLF